MPKFRGLPKGKRGEYSQPRQQRYNTPHSVNDWQSRPSRGNRKWSFFLRGPKQRDWIYKVDSPDDLRNQRSFRRLWCRSLPLIPIPVLPVDESGRVRSWEFISDNAPNGYWTVEARWRDDIEGQYCWREFDPLEPTRKCVYYYDEQGNIRQVCTELPGGIRYEYENKPEASPGNNEWCSQEIGVCRLTYIADASDLWNNSGNILPGEFSPSNSSYNMIVDLPQLGGGGCPNVVVSRGPGEEGGEIIVPPGTTAYYEFCPDVNRLQLEIDFGPPAIIPEAPYASAVGLLGDYWYGYYKKNGVWESRLINLFGLNDFTGVVRVSESACGYNVEASFQYSSPTATLVFYDIDNNPVDPSTFYVGGNYTITAGDYTDGEFARHPGGSIFPLTKEAPYYCGGDDDPDPQNPCTLVIYAGVTTSDPVGVEIGRITRSDGTCPAMPPDQNFGSGGTSNTPNPTPQIRCEPYSVPGDPYYETIWNETEARSNFSQYYYTCDCPYYSGQVVSLSSGSLQSSRSFSSGAPSFLYQQPVCKHIFAAMRANGDVTDADIPYDQAAEAGYYERLSTTNYLAANPVGMQLQNCSYGYVTEIQEDLGAEIIKPSRDPLSWYNWDGTSDFGKIGNDWDKTNKF